MKLAFEYLLILSNFGKFNKKKTTDKNVYIYSSLPKCKRK